MPLAGSSILLEASTDDSSYAEIDGIHDASFSPARDLADVTALNDSNARVRFALLKDGSISLSGDYEPGDTTGQNRIRTQFDSGAIVYIRFKWDGTNGHKVACLVENSDISGARDGVIAWSASLQFTGAPVAVP